MKMHPPNAINHSGVLIDFTMSLSVSTIHPWDITPALLVDAIGYSRLLILRSAHKIRFAPIRAFCYFSEASAQAWLRVSA